jgi:ribosomal protein L40E
VTYVLLVKSVKTERCVHCGASNPIEASTCRNCSESTMQRVWDPMGLLAGLAMIMSASAMIIALLSALPYEKPPIGKLLVGTGGIVIFILDMAVALTINNNSRRRLLKQRAIILQKGFFGGFCGGCGAEILGGITVCPQCGWRVESETPNWISNPQAEEKKPGPVELKILCYKCKAENPSGILRCQICSADLLTYKPVWLRFLYFVSSLLFSAGAGWLAYKAFENPNLNELFSLLDLGVVALTLIAIVMPFYGIYLAFGKGAFDELLVERAGRHKSKFPWQALTDYSHALAVAPAQRHLNILSNRISIYQSFGLLENATRDELAITYARENNPEGGVGLFLGEKLFGGAGAGASDSFRQGFLAGLAKKARKDRERMFREGRVIALGYCPTCKEAVKLTDKLQCPVAIEAGPKRHFRIPKYVQYVVPADIEAGRAYVSKALAVAKKRRIRRAWTAAMVILALIILYYLLSEMVTK